MVVHDKMGGEQEDGGVTTSGIDSAWMRRHLTGSVYLWACGEKANDEDDEPKLFDRLIGWLILLKQGFAYTMLVFLARDASDSDTTTGDDDSRGPSYALPTVVGAMYLLVASTAHDLRAGFSLLVDGTCAGHRAFGIGLLIVYGIMIDAAMTVLVQTSDDSASVVLNAVTVLFVADLDEKALTVLVTVPQKWRLFWAVQSAGVSFALALIAIYYIGDASPFLEGNNGILKSLPTWFVWVVNPVAVTLFAIVLSSTMHAVCNLLSEARQRVDEPKFGVMVASSCQVIMAAVKRAAQGFRREPGFYVALVMWLGQAVAMWSTSRQRDSEWPVAALFHPSSPGSDHARLSMTDNISGLLYSNIVFVIGLAVQAVRVVYRRHTRATVVPLPRHSLEPGELIEVGGRHENYGLPSLLVGSGIGYWVSSLLYVLFCSWHGGGCGWNNAPVAVTMISYVVVPCFFMASMFMVAEENFFGARVGTFTKPAVDILKDRRSIAFWTMMTVFRDLIDVWIGFCHALMTPLIP